MIDTSEGTALHRSPLMDIQACIDTMKIQLEEHETFYCHAIATGDWDACSFHKNRVASLRAGIGRLVKQKLAATR